MASTTLSGPLADTDDRVSAGDKGDSLPFDEAAFWKSAVQDLERCVASLIEERSALNIQLDLVNLTAERKFEDFRLGCNHQLAKSKADSDAKMKDLLHNAQREVHLVRNFHREKVYKIQSDDQKNLRSVIDLRNSIYLLRCELSLEKSQKEYYRNLYNGTIIRQNQSKSLLRRIKNIFK